MTDLLARLDPDRREAFVLTQLLGLPYAEAAEVAGCPVGTIRSRVARARADLIESLAGVNEDGAEGRRRSRLSPPPAPAPGRAPMLPDGRASAHQRRATGPHTRHGADACPSA